MLIFLLGRFWKKIDDEYINRLCLSPLRWFCIPCIIGYYLRFENKDFLKENGIIVFLGEQGDGKTISMTNYFLKLCKKYPKAISQENYINCNLSSWRDLLQLKNGRYGVITAIDEIGLWLNSKNSKDMDVALLQIVAQNRKDSRVILATAQQYYQICKDARTQVKYFVHTRTFFGCVTFNKWVKPVVDDKGEILKEIPFKFNAFIQSPYLRNSYDTLKTITALSKDGFIRKDLVYENPINDAS